MIACLAGAVLGGLAVEGCQQGGQPRRLPNGTSLLLVTLDTTRRDFVSPYGADPRITPNLQRLADEGTLFWNAYSQANTTSPTHLTIMTGLTLREHGVFNNRTSVPEELDTLPEALARAGFETAAFPSIPHVGEDFGWQGFDRFAPAEGDVDARDATNRVIEWLEARDSGRPFFAWLHYWDPHTPYFPPSDIQSMFYDGDPSVGPELLLSRPFFRGRPLGKKVRRWLEGRRDPEWPPAMYAGEVHYVDRELGRLIAYLEERGIGERTAIVVVADHGESLDEHGIFYTHAGLYEPQVRIPFLVKAPGLPGGLKPEILVSQIDVVPTIMELLGVSLQHEPAGMSLVPWLADEASSARPPRKGLIYESAHNRMVSRRLGRWKLIWPIDSVAHLRSQPHLFDLEEDPDEEYDLHELHPQILERMSEDLDSWTSLGVVDPSKEAVHLPDEALDRLRALGYVN